MKGIILAGGRATRLYPVTRGVCKQLLPIYDKPMIYYPLSVLMLAGIKDIMVIATQSDVPKFQNLLGDGSDLGVKISYAVQDDPKGIAQAFLIAEKFIDGKPVCLVLGDNIFYGYGLTGSLKKVVSLKKGATVFAYYVKDPQRYGVVDFDKKFKALSIVEKPREPKSNWAVTGLYFYDHKVTEYARALKPSKRGELEITDLNNIYLNKQILNVQVLGRGYAWLDTGTYDSLIDASVFIKTIQERQGLKIGCIEEIAFHQQWIDRKQLLRLAQAIPTEYGTYLSKVATNE